MSQKFKVGDKIKLNMDHGALAFLFDTDDANVVFQDDIQGQNYSLSKFGIFEVIKIIGDANMDIRDISSNIIYPSFHQSYFVLHDMPDNPKYDKFLEILESICIDKENNEQV